MMLRIFLSVCAFAFLIGACKKDNIDEIVVEEVVFAVDSLIELGGSMSAWSYRHRKEIFIDELGFAFRCTGARGDTVSYVISNEPSSFYFYTTLPTSDFDPDAPSGIRIEWDEIGDSIIIRSEAFFYASRDQGLHIPSVERSLTITNRTEDFIEGKYEGGFNLEFSLPIYKACESSWHYTTPANTSIGYPYVASVNDKNVEHNSCLEDGKEQHLISTIPTSLEQYHLAPNSLLQNEDDFYVYWETSPQDTVEQVFNEFDARIKKRIFETTQIYELSNHPQVASSEFPVFGLYMRTLKNEKKTHFDRISIRGLLRPIGEEQVIGNISISVDELPLDNVICD